MFKPLKVEQFYRQFVFYYLNPKKEITPYWKVTYKTKAEATSAMNAFVKRENDNLKN